jgi:uncharacterized protein (TIGR02147 family)
MYEFAVTQMNYYYSDYRKYLQEAFESRIARNPRYSQRAFARDLGLATSTLAELMKGKYGLSVQRALEVGEHLNLSELQRLHFADLFTMEFARSEPMRKKARLNVQTRVGQSEQEVHNDAFVTISEWHHLALIELLEIEPHTYQTADRLATRLSLTEVEVTQSLQRLERLSLIHLKEERLLPTGDFTSVGGEKASEAIRKFHKQILDKAQRALTTQDRDEREFSSTVFSVARQDIDSAKKFLQKFRREFAQRFSKSKNLDDVFCLSVQFFSLLEKEKAP